jgi:hypothetical protein
MPGTDAVEIEWSRYAVPVGGGVVEWSAARAAEAAADGEHEFVASTSGEASDGDIVDQASWRLAQYRSNPVVLYEHAVPVIGTARVNSGGANDEPLRAWITFDASDDNPIGRLAKSQHVSGVRSAVSVRWRPGKLTPRDELDKAHPAYSEGREIETWWGGKIKMVGRYHQNNTLLEISSVALPADPRALQVRGAHGLSAEQIRSALSDGRDVRSMRDDLLDLLRADPEIRGLIRSLYASAPPPDKFTQRVALADALRTLTDTFRGTEK